MPHDPALAERVRRVVPRSKDVLERSMFGGVCFLVNGNMAVGVANDDVMVRVGPEAYEPALRERHARPMDFTGRPMRGYVFVGPGKALTDDEVAAWVERGFAFARALPPK